MPTTHLLYLHGFRSSPQSMKARKVAARVQAQHPGVTWWCPPLPPSPREAMNLILRGIAGWPCDAMAVVGSSLRGFYATWVAQQTGCPAVPLNPAVDPARDLAKYIGEQTSWHIPDDRFFFQAGVHRGARPERCRSHDPGQQHLRPVAGRIWRARHLPQPGEPGTRREGVFPTGVGMNRPL